MGKARPLVAGLGGTLRERSHSRAALLHTLGIAEAEGAETAMLDLRELNLPMHIPDLPLNDYPAEAVPAIERLVDTCRRADVFVWSSPAYHGTVAGVFKNALDMLELLIEDDPPYLSGKGVGLMAVADSTPLIAMASSVHELRAWTAPTRLTLLDSDFTADLRLADGAPIRRATRLVRELISFSTRGGPRG